MILQAPEFAISYASMLCNIYEVCASLGKHEEGMSYLGSALKSLNKHANEPSVAPYIGRCLFLSASAHAHARDAVTAEGLFRAAIEKFSTPYALFDSRYIYVILFYYHFIY